MYVSPTTPSEPCTTKEEDAWGRGSLIKAFDAILCNAVRNYSVCMEIRRKYLLQKLNSGQLMNCKVKILGKRFYSPSLKDVDGLESVQLRF